MGDRCTGHCCKHFYLPYSPREIDMLAEGGLGVDQDELGVIAKMVIQINVGPGGRLPSDSESTWFYTCRNYDEATGNCGIYDTRPKMCSAYPYGNPCRIPGCTWDAVRVRRHLPIFNPQPEQLTVDDSVETAVGI